MTLHNYLAAKYDMTADVRCMYLASCIAQLNN